MMSRAACYTEWNEKGEEIWSRSGVIKRKELPKLRARGPEFDPVRQHGQKMSLALVIELTPQISSLNLGFGALLSNVFGA